MRRVLIVVDVYGWAWDRMAQGIAAHSPKDIEVTVLSQSDFNTIYSRAPWVLKSFDGISQCSWTEAQAKIPMNPGSKRTVWLASHGFEHVFPPPDPQNYPQLIATSLRNIETAATTLHRFDKVLCVSNRILESMKNTRLEKAQPLRVTPGVDTKVFQHTDPPSRAKLVIGWCGQREGKTKGFHEVLLLVRKRLGNRVDWQINTRSARDPLTQDEMVAWYRGIDLFISTSCSEGFQMPVLEAAASGRALLATDVGAACEVIDEGQNGYLITPYWARENAERSADEFTQHILTYDKDRDKLLKDGIRSRRIVESRFQWSTLAPQWLEAML